MNRTPVEFLSEAIGIAGSQSALASALNARREQPVSPARVWNWLNRDGGAPAEFCPDIEAITGIRCEDLYPNAGWAVLRKSTRKPKPLTA